MNFIPFSSLYLAGRFRALMLGAVSLLLVAALACGQAAPEVSESEQVVESPSSASEPAAMTEVMPGSQAQPEPAPEAAMLPGMDSMDSGSSSSSSSVSQAASPTSAPAAASVQEYASPEVSVEVERIVEVEKSVGGPPAVSESAPASQSSQGAVPASAPSGAARGSARGPGSAPSSAPDRSVSVPSGVTFQDNRRSPSVLSVEDAVSTFSLDTDRTSYRLALEWARQGYAVEPDSVRAEEWINSFYYGYPKPSVDNEFALGSQVYGHPLSLDWHMARLSFQAPDVVDDALPLNVTIVLDTSGSMRDGGRLETAKAAANAIVDSLVGDKDWVSVIDFEEEARLRVDFTHPDDSDLRDVINGLVPGGSTNVQAAVDLAVSEADWKRRQRPGAYNYIILFSDGVANVDATDPFAILGSAPDRGPLNPLRIITVGVGIDNYNDVLLEQLAQHGNGWYRYLDTPEQAQALFARENWLTLSTPFADQARVQVKWDPDLVYSWRIVG